MKFKKLIGFVLASTMIVGGTSSVFATDIYSNMSGDERKVTSIATNEKEYVLEVGKEYDFAKEIKVFESKEKLITNHNYIEYSLTGSSNSFSIYGSTVTALEGGKSATLTILDGYSKKVKCVVPVKSLDERRNSNASGFVFEKSNMKVPFDSTNGVNSDGLVFKVVSTPRGSQFTENDLDTIGKDVGVAVANMLGFEAGTSSAKFPLAVSFVADTNSSVGTKAKFTATINATADATTNATATFELGVLGGTVESAPAGAAAALTAIQLAQLFNGKQITATDGTIYNIVATAGSAVLTFEATTATAVAEADLTAKPVTLTVKAATSVVDTAQSLTTVFVTAGTPSASGTSTMSFPAGKSPVLDIAGETVVGKKSTAEVTTVKGLIDLFVGKTVTIDGIVWDIKLNLDKTGLECVIADGNKPADLAKLKLPAEVTVTDAESDVVGGTITTVLGKGTMLDKENDSLITYDFATEYSSSEIVFHVTGSHAFTAESLANSLLTKGKAYKLNVTDVILDHGKADSNAKASATFTAVDAVEAKGVVFAKNEVTVKVGETLEVPVTTYPNNANVFGTMSVSNQGTDDYAYFDMIDRVLHVTGVNSTGSARTDVNVELTTPSGAVNNSQLRVLVKSATTTGNPATDAKAPALSVKKLTVEAGKLGTLRVVNLPKDVAVTWTVADETIVSTKNSGKDFIELKAEKLGTSEVTAELSTGEKLVGSVVVIKPVPVAPDKTQTDVPQTGDSWLSNLL